MVYNLSGAYFQALVNKLNFKIQKDYEDYKNTIIFAKFYLIQLT